MDLLSELQSFISGQSDNILLEWGGRIIVALAVLGVGYLIAKFTSKIVGTLIDRIPALQVETSAESTDTTEKKASVGDGISTALYWMMLLVVWTVALSVMGMTQVVQPVQNMFDQILGFLPEIIGAAAILGFGLIFAGIVRQAVQSVLEASRLESLLPRADSEETDTQTGNGLSAALSWLVYALIAVPVVIASVNALQIAAVSVPATNMLNQIMAALPNIVTAGLILTISFFAGRLVHTLATKLLPQLGLDTFVSKLGLISKDMSASRVVANLGAITVMLFGAVEATRVLSFQVLSDFTSILLSQGGQILFGGLIIMAGIILSNIAGRVVEAMGEDSNPIVAKTVRYSILALAVILGVSSMRLDPTGGAFILDVARYVLIAASAALALAFGLGGRNWAGKQLENWRPTSASKPSATDFMPPTARRRTTSKTASGSSKSSKRETTASDEVSTEKT
jgi:hypothetical protein